MSNLGPVPCSSSQRGSFSLAPARMSLISLSAGCLSFGTCPAAVSLGTGAAPRYLGEAVALLRRALRFARGVAQGEHDGPLIEGCHVLQQLLRESARNSRHTWNSNGTVSFPTARPQCCSLWDW